jgi:signal peptide peptidase SppA
MLQAHYNFNLNKGILAIQPYYEAFKNKFTKADMEDEDCDFTIVPPSIVGAIGVIDFKGFTVNDCEPWQEELCGCISLQRFQKDLTALVANEQVSQVVINFDSGGGYIMGVQETAELVNKLSKVKPIYAYTSGLMCSAAYKIASQATNILASPSSMLGSIGVYCEYVDQTKALDIAGIVVKTFQGGSKKTVGSPYISLTPEQEKEIQDDINAEWELFKAVVKSTRGDVQEAFMQGQAFTGKDAITQGTNLADGNINSLDEFIKLLSVSNN